MVRREISGDAAPAGTAAADAMATSARTTDAARWASEIALR
jgi:hypothetical protein